jgi:hypothetical protein
MPCVPVRRRIMDVCVCFDRSYKLLVKIMASSLCMNKKYQNNVHPFTIGYMKMCSVVWFPTSFYKITELERRLK